MKKTILILTITALIMSMVGCNSVANTEENSNSVKIVTSVATKDSDSELNVSECMMAEKINFEALNSNDLPESLKDMIDHNHKESDYELIKTDDGIYLVVYMGEMNSGGHQIQINHISLAGDEFIVSVEETYPDSDAMVTMAITYPLTVVKVDSDIITDAEIFIDRFTANDENIGSIIDENSIPSNEDYYISPIDAYAEGEVITVGEIMDIIGDTIHIISGDLIEVFKADSEMYKDFYIGERVQFTKTGTTFSIESFITEDFSVNYTNMGHRIYSVIGQVKSIDGDNFELQIDSDELLNLTGAEQLEFVVGQEVELEYIDFYDGNKYAYELIKASELFELKILAIKRLDNGMMTLEATTDLESEEVSYIVSIDTSTTVRLNLSELKVGDLINAYAEEILESYPMQMTPKKVSK